ncbi:hypothetical protein V6N13_142088 [Hibiscus sabdariffa]
MQITSLVEARRQEDQGINFCSRLCWMDFGEPCVFSSSNFCISGLEYRYALVVPVPRFLVGIRVSVLLGEYRYSLELVPVPFESRIGTARPNVALYRYSGAYRLSCGMARPSRGVRGGGQTPVRLDEVEIEQGDEETLPPPPPVGGEANEGGAGPQGEAGPQVAQGSAVGDMTPLIQAIAGTFQIAMAGVQGAAQPQGGGNGLPLERLRHLGGVEFRGLPPERSEAWLESTIRILGQMECTDARKLGCVVSLLQGDAYAWWTTVTSSLDEGETTWEFFQSAFRKKYLGTRYEDEKKREFMALVKGSMSMSEYEIQFVRLSQYAPELVPTERDRCDRFRYGLVKEVKTYVLAYDYTDFDVLVARAKDIEQSLGLPARASRSSAGKRSANWDKDSAKRHKDRRYQPEPRRGSGNPGGGHQGQGIPHRAPECAKCGRRHMGECWGNGSTCWNCGVRGHMRRDCPHPARDGQALVRAAEPQRGRGRGRGNFQRGNDGQRNVAHVVAVQPEVPIIAIFD